MQVHDCRIGDQQIDGLKLVQLVQHGDSRGFFIERYHAERFAENGLPDMFVQDNHSRSAPGVLRGLHMQHTQPMGKLVGVIRGRIWDVAVDVRPTSKTFGRYFGVELTGDNAKLLWIPAGFAHGFCVLGDEPADVFYKVDALFNPKGEIGIRYDDPKLAIDWPIKTPIISARDQMLGSFDDYCVNPPSWPSNL